MYGYQHSILTCHIRTYSVRSKNYINLVFTIPEFLKKLNKMVFTSQTHLLLLYLMYIMYEKLYTCSILEIH